MTLRGAPLLWKSSRQSTISLSTAEAELNELIEGLMMGESVAAILEELEPHIMKMMASDLQAAVSICLAEGGSWRTRHLQIMPNRDSPKETGCRDICQVDICWQT